MGGKLRGMKKLCLPVLFVFLLAACAGSDVPKAAGDEGPCSREPATSAPSPSPSEGGVSFATGKAILEGDDGSVLLDLEIADSPEQHQQGLMNRTELDDCSGM